MKNILDRLVQSTRARMENDMQVMKIDDWIEMAALITPRIVPFAWEHAIAGAEMTFICEVKKASPSKGVINADADPVEVAKIYSAGGAEAISVLTEPEFFLGSDQYLQDIVSAVSTPVLRKDFTVHEYQIAQAAGLGSQAVLLIVAILEQSQLRDLHNYARSLGLSVLVEAHDEHEVERALQVGAKAVGINNRNLRTFGVDAQRAIHFREFVGEEALFVAESGIKTPADTAALSAANVDAVLIGETLMSSPDPAATLAKLRAGARAGRNLK